MSRPVLLMSPLYAPTQTELEATWQVQRHHEAADKAALVASIRDGSYDTAWIDARLRQLGCASGS